MEQEALYTLKFDGCRHKTALEVLFALAGKMWLCSRSAYTTGGGTLVVRCEANDSGFSTDDTYFSLGMVLNNTQKPLAYLTSAYWPKVGTKPGGTCKSDTRFRLYSAENWDDSNNTFSGKLVFREPSSY